MLLTVHDELVFEAPPDEKAAMTDLVKTQMEQVAKLDVPLAVDYGWGTSWGQAH
jgi:DNA polymerase-1